MPSYEVFPNREPSGDPRNCDARAPFLRTTMATLDLTISGQWWTPFAVAHPSLLHRCSLKRCSKNEMRPFERAEGSRWKLLRSLLSDGQGQLVADQQNHPESLHGNVDGALRPDQVLKRISENFGAFGGPLSPGLPRPPLAARRRA